MPNRASLREGNRSMALIWLPDECNLPNTAGKRKRRVGEGGGVPTEPAAPLKVAKSNSFVSESCSSQSSRSKASAQSATSSRCSYASATSGEGGGTGGGRVRIALGGM